MPREIFFMSLGNITSERANSSIDIIRSTRKRVIYTLDDKRRKDQETGNWKQETRNRKTSTITMSKRMSIFYPCSPSILHGALQIPSPSK